MLRFSLLRLGTEPRALQGSSPAQVVPVRFTGEELAALTARAEREHLNRSEAIRQAVQEWARR
ncbi:ribbon-helix-helix protein, CopG family [Brachybacterium epidermidis]|uniref:ribbon-helix-helix protein, CopG family n=1 Tax=Brachybacterium epidermidis TaxID=2781983 RepID=UPI00398F6809